MNQAFEQFAEDFKKEFEHTNPLINPNNIRKYKRDNLDGRKLRKRINKSK